MATAGGQEFVIADHAGPLAAVLTLSIAAALEPRFTVVQETRRAVRQVWLDTFDWRLHAAGLVLRQVTGSRSGELVLATTAGEALASQPAGAQRWPRLAAVIAAGPLRDRIDPVVQARALLPLARAQGTLTLLRVLDGERKTVARITLDVASLADPVAAPLPGRLTLTAVRGYQAAADRAGRLLAAAEGFAASPDPAFCAVLAAAGRSPGEYTDKVDVALPPSTPARAALASVLLRLAGTIEANVGFVVRDVDTEFLHDLRVAVRRTRSALKLTGDALPDGVAARFADEFKWLGDLTTPTRDLDVYLTGFDQMAAGLRAASPGDLESLRAHLAGRRAIERRRLTRGLRSARFTALMAGWRAALEAAAGQPARRGPDIGRLAADRIARAQRRVAKRGAAIVAVTSAGVPPAGDLHALRKRCKELRYLLEFFGSLYDPAVYRRAVKNLKGLQDCLGEFQDGEVQRDAIRGFAAEMVAGGQAGSGQAAPGLTSNELTATLLAMGELTARLHEQQRRALEEVAGRFAEFARAGSLRSLRAPARTARS
ncbi:MAG TPA: CHAD domain-containing protein [Streptosporangiaceae bacterium]